MQQIAQGFKKLIKWTFISTVLAVIIGVTILYLFFPLQRVVRYVTDAAGRAIGRQITVQKTSFNVFRGVQLQGVTVSNERGFSKQPLLELKELWLGYDLKLLILERRVYISNIELSGVRFLYEKNKRGDNVSGMLPQSKAGAEQKKKGTGTKEQAKPAANGKKRQPVNLRIAKVQVRDSFIEYNDQSGQKKKNVKLSAINLTINDLSNDLRNIPVSARGSLRLSAGGAGSRLNFTLKEQGTKKFNVQLAVDKLPLDKFLAVFASEPAKKATRKKQSAAKGKTAAYVAYLKGYEANFSGTVSQFSWRQVLVPSLKFAMRLHDLQLDVTSETALYGGSVQVVAYSFLNKKGTPYTLKGKVREIDGKRFLAGAFDLERVVEGSLSAEADLRGTLAELKKPSGVISTTFKDGRLVNAARILPGIPDYICAQLNDRGFDLFFFKLIFRNGSPTVGALKAKGENLDIDQTVNLDLNKLKRQVQQDINREKKRVEKEGRQEINRKKAEVQKEIDIKKEKAKESVQQELQNKLKELSR
jgi:hypothetical protein